MSDVLIKGMDMPIGCGWSTENAYGFAKCPFYERCLEKGIRLTRESRPKDCPLVELPPHGDLIDRQKVLSYFETGYLMGANMDYEDINEIVRKVVPTVVEAST